MWNLHPGHTPRKSGSFCLCLKQGARTISAERSRALGQFSWIQLGILYRENRISEDLHSQKKTTQEKKKSCLIWVLHSRLQFLLHFSVLILGHSGFTFPQFVHFLPWALKVRFWGCRRNLWTKMQEMHYFRFLEKKKPWICRHKDKQRLVTGASICLRESCLQESNSLLVQRSPRSQLECHAAK